MAAIMRVTQVSKQHTHLWRTIINTAVTRRVYTAVTSDRVSYNKKENKIYVK